MPSTDTIKSRIIETRLVNWRNFVFIQDDDFKDQSVFELSKLKTSLIENEFIEPFYAWEHDDKIYCLDGKHRCLGLESLALDGKNVPDLLPATFLDLENIEQAAKIVLLFNSQYARISKDGFQGFLDHYHINLDDILEQINLPDLDKIITDVLPEPTDLLADPKDKPATMKLTFANAADLEKAMPLIDEVLTKFEGAFYSVSSGEI